MYQIENLAHHPPNHHRRTFGEPAYEFIKELFGANLKMDGVAAVLDKVVEDIERQECFVRISRIDMWEKRSGCFSGTCEGLAKGAERRDDTYLLAFLRLISSASSILAISLGTGRVGSHVCSVGV